MKKEVKNYTLTSAPASAVATYSGPQAGLASFTVPDGVAPKARMINTPFIAPRALPDGTRLLGTVTEFRDSPKKEYKGRAMILTADDGSRVLFPISAGIGYAFRDYAAAIDPKVKTSEAAEKHVTGKKFLIEKLGVKSLENGKTRTVFGVAVVE